MLTVDLARGSVRELNAALHRLSPDSNETRWRVLNPRGAHNIAARASEITLRYQLCIKKYLRDLT